MRHQRNKISVKTPFLSIARYALLTKTGPLKISISLCRLKEKLMFFLDINFPMKYKKEKFGI